MSDKPHARILTFLFTDLENSTRLWEQFPEAMRPTLEQHDALLTNAIENHGGRVIKTMGDGFHAVFDSPGDGAAAALAGQQAIQTADWPTATGPPKVRMGLHSGESQERGGDYYGSEVNRAARVMGLGAGGQVLLSEIAAGLVKNRLPSGCSLIELGEHRLKGLAALETVFQLQHADLIGDFPALKSLAAFKHNLPRQLSSFVGRKREMAEVTRLLAGHPLITLLGPGGTGKTRLMLQAAEEVIEDFSDGVWLVELAALSDPDRVPERVAAALNIHEQPGRSLLDTLVDFLRRKDMLLLLDNVEHIVRACAEFCEHLLERCPRLKILISGREALFIAGEFTLQIPSLSLPEQSPDSDDLEKLAEFEAIQLFLERARAVRPDFALLATNAASLTEIVRRLDGIPLALELAAARLRMLTVDKIAERLSDRFRLLTGGRRTAIPRQQTLEALIDWSWQLIDDQERILFSRLSVFSGGWSLEAAEEVCGFEALDRFDVFDRLDQLINKSLVTVEHLPEGEPRYGMLESIRQFAQEKLIEREEGERVRDRHTAFFVAFTEAAEAELYKREAMTWVQRLRRDLDNLRAVMAWTSEEEPELALRLAAHLRHNQGYWIGFREADTWLAPLIRQTRLRVESGDDTIDSVIFTKALIAYGSNLVGLGHNVQLIDISQEARILARKNKQPRLQAWAVELIGFAHTFNLTPEHIREIEETVQICREQRYIPELAANLVLLGAGYYLSGNHEKGEQLIEEGHQISLELGSPREIASVADARSARAWYNGDWEKARAFALTAIQQFELLGARQNLTRTQSRLAHIDRATGNLDAAEAGYRKTILAWQEHGQIPALAHHLECFAYLAIARQDYRRAASLIGTAKTTRAQSKTAPQI
jgi:predicted ATPase/class 3 adenylate cyclase